MNTWLYIRISLVIAIVKQVANLTAHALEGN